MNQQFLTYEDAAKNAYELENPIIVMSRNRSGSVFWCASGREEGIESLTPELEATDWSAAPCGNMETAKAWLLDKGCVYGPDGVCLLVNPVMPGEEELAQKRTARALRPSGRDGLRVLRTHPRRRAGRL